MFYISAATFDIYIIVRYITGERINKYFIYQFRIRIYKIKQNTAGKN